MKKIVWLTQLVLFSTAIFLSSNASAACAYDESGNCIEIVVTPGGDEDNGGGGSGLPPGGGGGGGGGCGGGCGGGGGGGSTPKPIHITDRRFCINAAEVCSPWGNRAQGICASLYGENTPSGFWCTGEIELEKLNNCDAVRAQNSC